MEISKSELSTRLERFRGKKLISVSGSVHEHEGNVNLENPFTICMDFGESNQICLTGTGNGESLRLVDSLQSEADMDEYGQIRTADLSSVEPWAMVTGQSLTQASLVVTKDSVNLGLEFVFENHEAVSILNLDDEIFTYHKVPSEIIAEEAITYVKVV